ncbi:sensor histidine kinase [Agromyces kandeliae]|nr:GAF domain-containing sensor histidine kinase [Agromyces kandeliae]
MGRSTSAPRWAWAVTAVAFASGSALVAVLLLNAAALPSALDEQLPFYIGTTVFAPIFSALAAVILRRFPRHPIAWIMVGVVVGVIADTAARWYAITGLYLEPGSLPGVAWAAWFAEWNWFPSMLVLFVFVPLLFPDGSPPGPRWRPVVIGLIAWLALATIGYALYPSDPVDFARVERPVAVEPAIVLAVLMLLTPVAIGVGLAAVVVRWRRTIGDEHEQLRWMLWAASLSVAGWAVMMVAGTLGTEWGLGGAFLTWIPLLLIPVSVTIAIVKYRLYDIDLVINRTLVYGALTVAVLAAYGLFVLAVTALTPLSIDWRGSVLIVLVVAIAAYPLREWLQRMVNRRMYGDRDDPAKAMSRLARRVSDALAPAGVLPAVAESVGQALRVPYVAVRVAGVAGPTAAFGTPTGDPERFELVHQGEAVGVLEVGRRSERDQFSPADVRLLEDVARQVAGTVRAVQLATELQASRERLVLAREEERRRLRRDIHDGVGSALAGLALQAGNLRRALPDSPDVAIGLASTLEASIQGTIRDIRRIVDDLRPPALDDLGLDGALHERAAALLPGAATLEVRLDGAQLPAAVEVAAYRIATEAMTNAARHSGSERVRVLVDATSDPRTLRLEVSDDGAGMSASIRSGVGLPSMRERAVELGGSCEVDAAPEGGARVRASIPIMGTDDPGDRRP